MDNDIRDNKNSNQHEQGDIGLNELSSKAISMTKKIGLKVEKTKEEDITSIKSNKLNTERKTSSFHSENNNKKLQTSTDSINGYQVDNETNIDDEDSDSNNKSKDYKPKTESNSEKKKAQQHKMREIIRDRQKKQDKQEIFTVTSNDGFISHDKNNLDITEHTYDASIYESSHSSRLKNNDSEKSINIKLKNNKGQPRLQTTNKSDKRGFSMQDNVLKASVNLKNKAKSNKKVDKIDQKINKKYLKIRKKHSKKLAYKEFKLKRARQDQIISTSKLLVNKGDSNKNNKSKDDAEKYQETLNKNAKDFVISNIKSVHADFKNFEANLFKEDKNKSLQVKLNRKKQRKKKKLKKKINKLAEKQRKIPKGNSKGSNIEKRSLDNRNYKQDNYIENKYSKDNYIENNSKDIMGNVSLKKSKLKHQKTDKNINTYKKHEKLKFCKDNNSLNHSRANSKIKNNKTKHDVNKASTQNSKKELQKAIQKQKNKKLILKKSKNKEKKNLVNKVFKLSKKSGQFTVKQALVAFKLITKLILKKILSIFLFIALKMMLLVVGISIPIIIILFFGLFMFGTVGTALLTSYLADKETLTQTTAYYATMESELKDGLSEDVIIMDYNVDEVNFILIDNIGHNPHHLLAYLTAKYQDFTFDQVKDEVDTIFSLHYTKTVNVRLEIRDILDEYGNVTGETQTVRIADVTLKNNGFYNILYGRLNADEREHFKLLIETRGNRQFGGIPMSWDWLLNITEIFTNQNNGIEVAVPFNTVVYGTINGEISAVSNNSVSIKNVYREDTIIITFSKLNSVVVDIGDTVSMETIVGYTSDRVFIQIQRNGIYLNPMLFIQSQEQDLEYGTTQPPLTQSEFNLLMDFASAALGTPYVFGGNGPPPRGIDCSGFIWWAFNGSGLKTWSRTTAQGIFNQSDPITSAEARPGDLIFFQGTYDTQDSRVVTHVGIYLGNGQMQHSGSPNEIVSVNSEYWQRHFYSYGRLRR